MKKRWCYYKVRFLKLCLTLWISFFFSFYSTCQEKEYSNVQKVLERLTLEYNVSFSYLDKLLRGLQVQGGSDVTSLDEQLKSLESQTNLLFIEISPGNYVIEIAKEKTFIICGFLKDKESLMPLEGALIYGSNFTTTDPNGYFQIEVPFGESVMIQYLGFFSIRLDYTHSGSECLPIYLIESRTILPEVKIYNYLSEGINKSTDGSFLISVDPMRILPGLTEPDILHSLQFLPGIQSTNETVSDINIRGGTADQNLILYDGVRIYQSGHFFGLISVFNPHSIKEAQLIKRGTSVRYGDAVSGTVVLRSKDEVPEKLNATAGLNMLNADLSLEIPMGEGSGLFISGRRSIGDVIETPTYKSYFERVFKETEVINSSPDAAALANSDERFYFYDFNTKFIRQFPNRDQIKVFGLSVFNEVNFLENAVVNNIIQSRRSELKQNNVAGGLNYSKWWNKGFTTEVQASVSAYKLKALNADVLTGQELSQENDVTDIQLKVVSKLKNNKNDFLFGYQGNNLGVLNGNSISTPRISEELKRFLTTHTLFVENNLALRNSELRLGVRSSYFTKSEEFSFEPRLSLFSPITTNLSIEVTGEMKSQSVFQKIDLQTDFLGIEKRKWVLPQKELFQVLQGKQLTFGIQYEKEKILINAEGYVKKVENISSVSQGFLNQFERIDEEGSYQISGIDGLVNLRFKKLNMWVGYAYMNNKFKFPGLIPPEFLNSTNIPHNLSFGANYKTKRFEIATGFNWHLGRPFTAVTADSVVNNQISYGEPNGVRLDDYLRIDFSSQYKFYIKETKARFGFSLWNVTNRDNIINSYFKLDQNLSLSQIKRSALPFTANVFLRVQLE